MTRLTGTGLIALLCIGTNAIAQESYPRISGEFAIEIENDYTFSATDNAAELNDLFATVEGALALEFTAQTSLNATLVFEPVQDAVDDRVFEDHGLYAEELFLQHDFDMAALKVGKFNPAFGAAWDIAPGIYGTDFAEDYEIAERIGAGVAIPFDAFEGAHELSMATFFADTTFLSESAFENRGRTTRGAGGVSNTESPESFAVSLAGTFGATGYNAGVQYQTRGEGDAFDQSGFVLGVTHALAFGDDTAVELLAEAAYFPHFDGAEERAFYTSLGAAAPIGPITVSAVYGLRDVENADTDHLATTSAEMEIFDGLSAGLGYRFGREDGETAHTFGALLVYEFGI